MTEKRFMVDDAGTLIDIQTRNTYDYVSDVCPLLNALNDENEQLKQSNERIVKDIDLALGFIRHKGYSLQDIKDYEDAKKEYEEDLAYYRNGDVE